MSIETLMKKYEQQPMQSPNVAGVGIGKKSIFSKQFFVIAKVVADT